MMTYFKCYLLILLVFIKHCNTQCPTGQSLSYIRWSGFSPENAAPVFVYSASGEEESLTGACLARCRELPDCAAVIVAYTKGNCHGVANPIDTRYHTDYGVAYFKKICTKLASNCSKRWWALENTPGYYFNSESPSRKLLLNTTVQQCYQSMLSSREVVYRSAQWIDPNKPSDTYKMTDKSIGDCILNGENKFTEPESYRVSNYYTLYMENQCNHDYPYKIDRCSYEEYNNQTLRHVDVTYKNITRLECKSACEMEQRFVCRGFSFTMTHSRGICDLHSEDLITSGSWLLRRIPSATYYRRVICLNISVECNDSALAVTYYPRGVFRGRMYVPGRGERCSSHNLGPGPVRITLPLHGECDVNFAYAITKGPNGVVNKTMAYVMLMIQNNPIIQAAGDRWVRAGCSPDASPYTKVNATVTVQDAGRPTLDSASSTGELNPGASAVYGPGSTPLTMYMVRAHGEASTAAVSLGEILELRIETMEDTEIEAYHLVASSRLGDSSILLLDSRGCPTGQVDFPPFTRTYVDGMQRLTAKFKAFRFPSSHIVRFTLMVRFCDRKCPVVNCASRELRDARGANETYEWRENELAATVTQIPLTASDALESGCGRVGRAPLELELVVGSGGVMTTDTLVRADHRTSLFEEERAAVGGLGGVGGMVCVHELLLVALALAWLTVQVLLLVGCCVLVKRYRNLAEMNMQKDYTSFDNVGFDTISTHRRVHWPDQNIDIIHAN